MSDASTRNNIDLMDPRDAQEAMQAFAQPQGGELAIRDRDTDYSSGGMTISDGVITAQKVAVERDERKVLQKLSTLAAIAGDDWFYRFPVKKKGAGQDFIEGPSIKCANNVARAYGNCQVDTRVVDAGSTWIIYARFVDYETGYSLTRPFQQDKDASKMGGDVARKRDIAFQIGVSKAIRNVVCNALETFTTYAFEEAQKNLVEKVGKKLPEYKERVKTRLADMGIALKRVELNLGRTFDAWLAPDVARVIAEIKAVSDGMATIEETWPPEAPPEPKRSDFAKQTGTTSSSPPEAKTGGEESGQAAHSPAATGGDSKPEASGQPAASHDPETGEVTEFDKFVTFSRFSEFSDPFLQGATEKKARAWEAFYRVKLAEYANSKDAKVREGVADLIGLYSRAIAPSEAA